MTESNIQAFMIRHASEPEDAMQEFPVRPCTDYEADDNFTSRYSGRNPITSKYYEELNGVEIKIHIVFECVDMEDALSIGKSMIMDKIDQYGTRFFWLNYFSVTHGWQCGLFYVGTPIKPEYKVIYSLNPMRGKVTLPLTFISVEGFKVGDDSGS